MESEAKENDLRPISDRISGTIRRFLLEDLRKPTLSLSLYSVLRTYLIYNDEHTCISVGSHTFLSALCPSLSANVVCGWTVFSQAWTKLKVQPEIGGRVINAGRFSARYTGMPDHSLLVH